MGNNSIPQYRDTSLIAAPEPRAHRAHFALVAIAGALLAGVHVHGALRRAQPPAETAEIGLYAPLAVLAAWLYHSLGQ